MKKKIAKKDKKKQAREEELDESKIKKNKMFSLNVTRVELVHLRDMLSILYPSESKKTISQTLADTESRLYEECILWKKVAFLCEEAELPVGDDSPDYAIIPIGHAPMGVFMLSQEEADILSEPKGFLKKTDIDEEE